jgi:hypothetical protein
MALWQKIMRIAALALLMVAASDVLVVDTAFAASCNSNPTSSTGSQQSPGPGDDDCYCCCTHIIPGASQIPLVTIDRIELLAEALTPNLVDAESQPIVHPPRS